MRFKQACFLAMGIWAACAPTVGISQTTPAISTEGHLFAIDDDRVPVREFLHIISKAQKPGEPLQLSAEEFEQNFRLFLHYKLKVKEAESRRMDETAAFKAELQKITEDLKSQFLLENSVQEAALKEAYAKMGEMVKASHILIKFPPEASAEDSLAVFRMAENLKEKAEQGADFNALALEYSEDPSAQKNGGKLGYFTAFQMVQPFEEAAYQLKRGEISEPVLTGFGYHLIKLEDRMPNPGEVSVAHILLRVDPGEPDSDARARRKISDIHASLQESPDAWEDMALAHSEDEGTKTQGGRLPYFGVGTMLPEFEEAAFSLKESGDISPPFKTAYGYHIVRLENTRPLPPYEAIKETLKSKIIKGQQLQETAVREAEERDLLTNNTAYQTMVNEYREGILLFNLMNELVWQKALADSAGLLAYFEAHADRYQWEERTPAVIVTVNREEHAAEVRGFLRDKPYSTELKDRLEDRFFRGDPLLFAVEQDLYKREEHPVLSKVNVNKKYHELFLDEKYYFVVLGETLPAGPKKFEETRGQVIQDYQSHLDAQLVETLIKKYTVKINEAEKERIFQELVQK